MTDLVKVSQQIEEVVAREVARIVEDDDMMSEKAVKVLEVLSKVLDMCQERRTKMPAVDPFAGVSTEDLSKEFV